MNKKKIGEKTDSLLEAEMIKEAKMIEENEQKKDRRENRQSVRS